MFRRLEGEETLKYRFAYRPRAEKLIIVSNDHGRTQKCYFSVLDWKYPFWANFVQKIKFASLS